MKHDYSGFRVDGTSTPICLLDGGPYKPPFGDCAIYSQSTIKNKQSKHQCRWSGGRTSRSSSPVLLELHSGGVTRCDGHFRRFGSMQQDCGLRWFRCVKWSELYSVYFFCFFIQVATILLHWHPPFKKCEQSRSIGSWLKLRRTGGPTAVDLAFLLPWQENLKMNNIKSIRCTRMLNEVYRNPASLPV